MELQRVPLSAFQLLGRGQLRQLGYFFRKISRFLRRYAQGQHHAKGQSQRDDLFTVHSFSSFLCRISIPYSGEWDNRQSVNGRGVNLRVFLRGAAFFQAERQSKNLPQNRISAYHAVIPALRQVAIQKYQVVIDQEIFPEASQLMEKFTLTFSNPFFSFPVSVAVPPLELSELC